MQDQAAKGAIASQQIGIDSTEAAKHPSRPSVACQRCRDQKLRCDRELPTCGRCRKQKAGCVYPPPPDRKRIAQRTRNENSSIAAGAGDPEHALPSTSPRAEKRRRITHESDESTIRVPVPSGPVEDALPPTELGLLLLEVYFQRIYNASLLFHKSTLFQRYMDDQMPHYLLRAIFSHAAIFLQEVDTPHRKYIKTLPMHSIYQRSWSWARSASQEVLAHADEPTLERIQTLEVLQFVYFTREELQRVVIHASLAYRMSQLLGYDRLYEEAPDCDEGLKFQREFRRRCFWACWSTVTIGSEQLDATRACERVAGLPLPAVVTRSGHVQSMEKMDQNWKSTPLDYLDGATSEPFPSILAEMVKFLGIWVKVQGFIASCFQSNSERAEELIKLMELSGPIERSSGLPLTDINAPAAYYAEHLELVVSICAIHHLSQMLMHSSMVPVLSGRPVEWPSSKDLVRRSAQETLQHAIQFSGLLQQLLDRDVDLTKLSPFAGYGAFVAGSIFVVYTNMKRWTRSEDPSVKVPGLHSNTMKLLRTVLELLSLYWVPLRRLLNKLNEAIKAAYSTDEEIIAATRGASGRRRSVHEPQTDIGDPASPNDPNDPNANRALLRTGYSALAVGDRADDDENVSSHTYAIHGMHATRSPNTHLKQGHLSEYPPTSQGLDTLAGAAESHAAAREIRSANDFSGFQEGLVFDPAVVTNDSSLFDAAWWNTVPSIDVWEYPFCMVEMPTASPMP